MTYSSRSRGAGIGSGTAKTRSRTVELSYRILAEGIVELHMKVGASQCVTIETDDNLLAHVKTETRGKMHLAETTGDVRPSQGIRVTVSAPSLEELRITGTVSATV